MSARVLVSSYSSTYPVMQLDPNSDKICFLQCAFCWLHIHPQSLLVSASIDILPSTLSCMAVRLTSRSSSNPSRKADEGKGKAGQPAMLDVNSLGTRDLEPR